MNAGMRKGLVVAALHVAIVSSLGAKLLVDRATRPRVWARAAPFDPNLPIRGRYVSLRLEAAVQDASLPEPTDLAVRDNQLVAIRSQRPSGLRAHAVHRDGHLVAVLDEPVAFFIPEHVPDPSRRAQGEELWVEVTLPRAGSPRPIRLGVKRNGVLTPLDLR